MLQVDATCSQDRCLNSPVSCCAGAQMSLPAGRMAGHAWFFDPVGMGRRPAKSHEKGGAGAFACQPAARPAMPPFRCFFDPVYGMPTFGQLGPELMNATVVREDVSGQNPDRASGPHVGRFPIKTAYLPQAQFPIASTDRKGQHCPRIAEEGAPRPHSSEASRKLETVSFPDAERRGRSHTGGGLSSRQAEVNQLGVATREF